MPQLKTITLGGALTGLGIESSSWRAGLPHEAALSFDVLTGAGEIVRATPDGPDAELFRAFPNSYGTLGYAAAATIELTPVHPYVHLRHVRFTDLDELGAAIADLVARRAGRPGQLGRRAGRLHRRLGLPDAAGRRRPGARGVPDAGHLGGQRAVHLGLHRPAGLLPVGPRSAARTG